MNEKENSGNGDGFGIRAVERVVALLLAFSRDKPELSVTELSEAVGLSKSTVFRFIRALNAADFIKQDATTKLCRLGTALIELGTLAMEDTEVRRTANPFMTELSRKSGETVHLGILDYGEVVYIDKVENRNRAVRLNSHIGKRNPAHCTALGKTLLAFLDDDQLSDFVERRGLRRFTKMTVASLEELREQCALVRRQGYAIDNGEFNEVVQCVAAPIFDGMGNAVASVSITAIGTDVDGPRFRELTTLVSAAAGEISAAMGYRGVPSVSQPPRGELVVADSIDRKK